MEVVTLDLLYWNYDMTITEKPDSGTFTHNIAKFRLYSCL